METDAHGRRCLRLLHAGAHARVSLAGRRGYCLLVTARVRSGLGADVLRFRPVNRKFGHPGTTTGCFAVSILALEQRSFR